MSNPEISGAPERETDQERTYMTGVQALVRILLEQKRRDEAAGLNTKGFASGYQGSPLGELDRELSRQKDFLSQNGIIFQPAINEELAATAVIGTQQAPLSVDANVDGVFGMWYGKGPGLDRASDALKHATSYGSAPHGGALVVVGDDHGAVSSSQAHQCEQLMASWMMPVLHPSSVQEYLEFGLFGLALSRYAGCWVGFKAVSETVESSASIAIDPNNPGFVIPNDFEMPADGANIRLPDPPLAQEVRNQQVKIPAAMAFARANGINRIVGDTPNAKIGIAATGKAYLYLRQALADLGIDEAEAARIGLRIFKIGMSWPLEPQGVAEFADGLDKILVVEEKRAFVESQIKELLYGLPDGQRPTVVGKTDLEGETLIASNGEIDGADIARALVRFLGETLETPSAQHYLAMLKARDADSPLAAVVDRPPYFCSGCPHNRSTKVPDGSRALAGTGCHLMAMGMNRNTFGIMHMGGEGVNWVGMAPFVDYDHIFQNLGDGTYVHSGILGLRQAIAAKSNMTFKILFNDAVAMTGGQKLEGQLTVPKLAEQVRAEGVDQIVIVADDPSKYPAGTKFPGGVSVHHRDRLDDLQKSFRKIKGVSAIIYDQTCAAELRRRRRRGEEPDPQRRVYINKAVCEGCGDCSTQSNCLSVMPVPTPYGVKRMIDQSACNKDFSCLEGFCPALVTLDGAQPRRKAKSTTPVPTDLPMPELPTLDRPYGIMVAGVGGTGVVTVGQLLGLAAHIEGRGISVLDFTGMAQKGGSVLTHVRISANAGEKLAARLPLGGADLLVAGDMVVGASPTVLKAMRPDVTRAVINANVLPVAASVNDPSFRLDEAELRRRLELASGEGRTHYVPAKTLSEALIGDSIAANIFLLGYAFQMGAVPLKESSLMEAIEMMGRAADENKASFAWGRLAAHDADALDKVAWGAPSEPTSADTVETLISNRAKDLTAYQDQAYANRYLETVNRVSAAEMKVQPDSELLREAVARSLYRLMAYKDEYEVARLYTQAGFLEELNDRFEGDYKLNFHMAPPFLATGVDSAGRPGKKKFGAWMVPALRFLAGWKGLRGTAFDPFSYQEERRVERRLIRDYERTIGDLLAGLTPAKLELAAEIAAVPEMIRGYGPVKSANIEKAEAKQQALLAEYQGEHITREAAE